MRGADDDNDGSATVDATRIVDTRDQAGFLVTTLTSTGGELAEEEVSAGFATAGGCSIVALYGIEEDPTRALAAELGLDQ